MYIQAETPADLGRYLRDVRESQKLDLHTVATHLHIRPKYLFSLEEGNLAELPGQPYIKGYVLNYAGYLGLDRNHILNIFEQVSGQKAKHVYYVPEPNRKENVPGPGVLILAMVIIAMAYVLWYAVLREDAIVDRSVTPVPASMWYALYHRPVDLTGNDCFGYKARYYPPCYPHLLESLPESELIAEMREWPEIKHWPEMQVKLAAERQRALEEQQKLQIQQRLQQIQNEPRPQEQIVPPNEPSAPQIQ